MIVASKGGADEPPAWYLNLQENPASRCRSGRPSGPGARRHGGEKPGLWKIMAAEWPPYDDYQKKTDREIRSSCSSAVRAPGSASPWRDRGGFASSAIPARASSPSRSKRTAKMRYPCSRRMRARPLMRGRSG